MIALHSSSQKRYAINGTAYTCYTAAENRAIANLILVGERDSTLLANANSTIEFLEVKASVLETKANTSAMMLKVVQDYSQDITNKNAELVARNNKIARRLKTWKKISGVTTAITILFIAKTFL